MKKKIVYGFTGLFFAWTTTGIAHTQGLTNTAKATIPISIEHVIPKSEQLNSARNTGSFFRNEINIKAVRSFIRNYKDVNDAKWFKSEHGFIVYFKLNDIETKALYDKKGNHEALILSYSEDQLPREIRHVAKRNYYDYCIYHVNEIRLKGKTTYIVTIGDRTGWKKVKVTEQEMELTIELLKS